MKRRRSLNFRKKLLLGVLTAAILLENIGSCGQSYAMEPVAWENVEVETEVSEPEGLDSKVEPETESEAESESLEAEAESALQTVTEPEEKSEEATLPEERKPEEAQETEEPEADRLEKLQTLLLDFPEEAELWWMSQEELGEVYDRFMELVDLYESLEEEEKSKIEVSKLEAIGEFFAGFTDQTALSNTGDIYSIPSEYGAGIIYQGRKSTAVYGPGWKKGTYATNHSKSSDVWIRYPESGSCYVNGEHVKADVLVYYWLSAGDAFVAMSFGTDQVSIGSPAWCGYDPQDFTVEMEYHFFRAGTEEELSVDGYLFAHDLDKGEGICGKTGARGYYTSDNTTMKWKGQYVTGTVDDDRTDYSMSVGVAFHSDAAAPFHVSYHGCEYYSIELSSVGVDGQLLRKYGSLQVTKNITAPGGISLSKAGFSMNLKGTSAYGDAIDQTVETNANGVASFSNIPMGTYVVSEQGSASYWDVPASGKVNIEGGQTSTYAVNNVFKTGNITLTKTIETAPVDAYNAEAEKAYHYNDSKAGFAYRLNGRSDSGIYVTKYGVTDANGKLTFSNLPVGTYTLQEIKASEVPSSESCKAAATQELTQYVIPASQTVTVTYDSSQHKGNTSNVTFANTLKKWRFAGSLKKVDEELKTEGASQGDAVLQGAVYGLYDGDKLIATATTDANGSFSFDGTYVAGDLWQVKEISASAGYLQDPTVYSVSAGVDKLTVKDGDTYQASLENTTLGEGTLGEQVKKQSLSFYKVTGSDKESSYEAVEGAKFSIFLVSDLEDGRYAALSDAELPQAIMDTYRDSETLDFEVMKNLSSVAEITSNSRGVVTTPALPYGRYLIVETTTPENKIATRPFVVNVTGDDTDGTVKGDGEGAPLEDLVIAVDRPITSLIRIKKLDASSHKTVLKAGAGYVIHDTDGAWFDYYTAEMTTSQKQAYKEKYGDLVVQSGQGELVGTKENPYTTKKISSAESTNNVYVDTPTALPVGTYTLEEVQAPEGYILQGKEGVIAKKTSVTTGNHTFYETEEEGAWDTGTTSTVNIVVSSQEAVFDTDANAFVIAASQQNDPAIGKISVYAEGEKLVSARQDGVTILDRLGDAVSTFFGYVKGLIGLDTPDEEGLTEKELSEYKDYSFTYENGPIEGATFEIRAAEDIYSPEGGDNASKLFSEGDLVVTLTTDGKGQAWTGQEDWDGTEIAKGLPLGKYNITETKAGTGFALSEENSVPREIEITYAGQEIPVIYRDSSYENPRQKVEIEVEKLDTEENVPLSGAVFGLYAKDDIVNAAGRTIVKAGTLLATGETTVGEDESVVKATFTPDLPLGKYYVKELMAPMGYTTTREEISIDATYQDDQREVLSFSETVKNDPVLLQVNLMDYFTEEELDGATLELRDADGNTFTTILSVHENNTIIRGLEIGKTYSIQGLVSPTGYHYNLYLKDDYETAKENAVDAETDYVNGEPSDSITVTIEDEGKLQVVSIFLKPVTGTITVEKTGEVPTGTEEGEDENGYQTVTPVYEVLGLPGAEYALLAKEDIVYPDGYTGTLFSTEDEVLHVYQELKDTTLKNYSVEVNKGELVDVSSYIGKVADSDASREEVKNFYNRNQNDVQRSLPDGTAVHYVLKTDDEGKAEISGLPLGEYEVIEVKAPNGYYRDQTDCTREVSLVEAEESGRTEEDVTAEAAFENARQKVQEKETEEKLPEPTTVIYHPAISITKNAEKDIYDPGETVIYHIVVTNTGDVDLTDVTVEDSLAGGVIKTIDALSVGASESFTYEYQIPEETEAGSRISNTVKTTGTPVIPEPGTDEYGREIPVDPSSYEKPEDSDTEKVLVRGGEVQILKEARERIYKPGDTAVFTISVVNPTDQTLEELTVTDDLDGIFFIPTDDNVKRNLDGTVSISELAPGEEVTLRFTWKVPENAAGNVVNTVSVEGYVKNPDGTDEDEDRIEVKDEDSDTIVIRNETEVDYGMAVTKYSLDEGSRVPTAGAAFTVYAKEDITNILGTVIYAAGTEIETAISAEDGVARFQTDFPIGKYVVKETKAPKGHYSSTKEITFDLTDEKYNDGTEYLHKWDCVENAITVVNIKLTDDLTGNELSGASLNVKDWSGNLVDAWITKTEDGYTIKGLDVDTDYFITETVPRDGYLTKFTDAVISSENAALGSISAGGASVGFKIQDVPTETYWNGITEKFTIPDTTRIEVKNAYVIGNVRINKDGEMLESWTLLDKVGAFVKSLFGYSKEALEGVTFEVRAAEDIAHPDGITGIMYHKGDLVATDVRSVKKSAIGTTDKTGTVSFENMYLGAYEIYETKTAEGYVRDTEPTAFTLAYVDGSTSPVSAVDGDITITNPRQKAEITVLKTDAETGEKLQGAVIGLYAATDIQNYSGAVIVPADTLLESAKTDADGKLTFASDLPLGSYYVKEIEAPKGYALNTEPQSFELAYAGDDKDVVKVELTITDQVNDASEENKTADEHHSSGSKASSVPAANTGDSANVEAWFILLIGSAVILAIAANARRKRDQK